MEKQKKNDSGITLVALVVSIIVMLVLAGVSLNATIGENGILKQAQTATIMQKFASYLEEFELNKVDAMIEDGFNDDVNLNYLGTEDGFLKYVPSIKSEDRAKFEIIGGYLVYIGDDSEEEQIAQSIGMKSQYDQVLYDVIGKEFETYILAVESAKSSGTISSSVQALRTASFDQINAGLAEGKKIPQKYKNDFILSSGVLTYTGTNEERLILLSTSSILAQYIRPVTGDAKLILLNYVSPVGVAVEETTTVNGKTVYKTVTSDDSNWVIRIDSTNGAITYGTIINYRGTGGTIIIPDTVSVSTVGNIKITAVEGVGSGSGTSRTFVHNIFQNEDGESTVTSNIVQVIAAKGIYQFKNYGLANLGSNIPFTLLHDGADLDLDEGTGIEGSCGSYTFVAPSTGNYKLKCWGASGAGWNKTLAEANNLGSDAGYGGYSEGIISLNAGEKLYINIGGKGLAAFEVQQVVELGTSNGSGGYNGGGNLPFASASANNAGGGCTDIRYGGSTYENQIIVAGGGGGVDDFVPTADARYDNISGAINTRGSYAGARGLNKNTAGNDGSGGFGGGTLSSTNKSTWSGGCGYVNGVIENNVTNILTGLALITSGRTFTAQMVWKDGFGLPGYWITNSDGTYTPSGYQRLIGEDSALGSNYGAAGGGYYGGTRAIHAEGCGGGGSAYADLSLLTSINGYADYKMTTVSGTQVQTPLMNSEIPQVTYYGRTKNALTYGNGYVAIEKQ